VKGTGQLKIEEVAIMFKAIKGARYVGFSYSGEELNAPVVRGS
jgi:hypothetical protein